MTRILVQRGSTGSSSSSSNQNRSSVSLPGSSASSSASSQAQASSTSQVPSALKDDELVGEFPESIALDEFSVGSFNHKGDGYDASVESFGYERSLPEDKIVDNEKLSDGAVVCMDFVKGSSALRVEAAENEDASLPGAKGSSCPPPPPPVPPPKPASLNPNPRKFSSGSSNALRIRSSREFVGQTNVSTRTSPNGSRPSSPRSHAESEGYNSADEQNPKFGSSCNDVVSPKFYLLETDNASVYAPLILFGNRIDLVYFISTFSQQNNSPALNYASQLVTVGMAILLM